MKKRYVYLISFIVPCIILFIASTILHYYPLGNATLRIFDAKTQYPGFFLALKSFSFYSLGAGLGFNLFATATYYLFSPLNLICIFLNNMNLDLIYTILIYLKIGFASLFMTIFLDYKIKDQKAWPALFGIMYTFSGFISCYYYNVMWLDGIYMLPLVMLGLEKIIHERKPTLYLISLTITILTNYYIGYMVCIFSVLYFFFLFFSEQVTDKKSVLKHFFISSILAGCICAIILLPSYFGLMNGKAYGFGDSYTKYFAIHDSVKTAFYHLSVASFGKDVQIDGFALIYFSIFGLILVVTSFFSKYYSKRYKILVGLMILIYGISFSFHLMDYAWQMFQRPVWWPSRYAFTFSAFLITIAYDAFAHREKSNVSYYPRLVLMLIIPLLFVISFAFIFSSLKSRTLISLLFLAFSILITGFYLFAYDSRKLSWLCIIMVIVELSLNLFNNMSINSTNSSVLNKDLFHKEVNKAVNEVKNMDSSNYRMELVHKNLYQDGLLYGYNGFNYFNSVRNQRMVRFAEEIIGLKVDSHCSMVLDRFDPLILSLFHIKYLIGNNFKYWNLAIDHSGLSAYENPYPLSYGILMNQDDTVIDFKTNDYIKNLEKIAHSFGAKESLYLPSSHVNAKVELQNVTLENRAYRIQNKNAEGHIIYTYQPESSFFLIPDDLNAFKKIANISINGEIQTIGSLYPFVQKGDKVEIDFHFKKDAFASDLTYYLLSVDAYETLMQSLSLFDVQDSKYVLEGNIKVQKEKQMLFLSLPYEEGFIIKVDGMKVDYTSIWDTFVGIPLEKGTHHITIDYVPKGFVSGMIISLSSIFVTTIYLSLTHKKYAIMIQKGNEL